MSYLNVTLNLLQIGPFRTFVKELKEELPWDLSYEEKSAVCGRRITIKGNSLMVRLVNDYLERDEESTNIKEPKKEPPVIDIEPISMYAG